MSNAALAQVHDEQTHRLNARMVSDLFGVDVAGIARVLEVKPNTLRVHPSAESVQPGLAKLVYAWNILAGVLPDEDAVRRWLHHPNRRLRGRTPLDLLQKDGLTPFVALAEEIEGGAYA